MTLKVPLNLQVTSHTCFCSSEANSIQNSSIFIICTHHILLVWSYHHLRQHRRMYHAWDSIKIFVRKPRKMRLRANAMQEGDQKVWVSFLFEHNFKGSSNQKYSFTINAYEKIFRAGRQIMFNTGKTNSKWNCNNTFSKQTVPGGGSAATRKWQRPSY
jgi:hypothetical protein